MNGSTKQIMISFHNLIFPCECAHSVWPLANLAGGFQVWRHCQETGKAISFHDFIFLLTSLSLFRR